MESLVSIYLPAVLYIVAIVLLVVLIIISVKTLKLLDRLSELADNVEDKINSVNGAISVIKTASDGIANITDTFVYNASGMISKIFGKNKNSYKEEEIDE